MVLGYFAYRQDLKRNSKFFVQLAAGKIWEKGPVDLSIAEKRIHPLPPKRTNRHMLVSSFFD
jgi:hypothetical protein